MPSLPAIPSAKDIWELVKAGATIEAQEKIMQQRQALLDLQEENVSLRQQTLELTQKLDELRRKLDLRAHLTFERGLYWLLDPTPGTPREGPFCQRCRDVDEKLVRLTSTSNTDQRPYWECRQCRNWYERTA